MTERLSKRGGAAPARVRAIALTGAGWADIRGSFAPALAGLARLDRVLTPSRSSRATRS